MNYRTYFRGKFSIDPGLTLEVYNNLQDLSLRRFKGDEFPSSSCHWISDRNGKFLMVDDQVDSFDDADYWIKYILDNVLVGYTLNGTVEATGEDRDDNWKIIVEDSVASTAVAALVYQEKKPVETKRRIVVEDSPVLDAPVEAEKLG